MNTAKENKMLIRLLALACMLFMASTIDSSAQSWQEYFNKAIDNAQAGNMEGAITNFTEALNFTDMPDARKAQAYYFRGIANAELGKTTDAIADLSQCINIDPNYKEAYLQRGLLYNDNIGMKTLGAKDAINDLNMAVKLLPDNRDAHWGRGIALSNLGNENNAEAAKEFTKAMELMDNDLESLELRGNVYRRMKAYDLAMKDFNELVRKKARDPYAYLNRGICYSQMKNYEYAIRDYTQAIVLDPNNLEAYFNRGLAYSRIDNHQLAISDFSKVISNAPQSNEEERDFVGAAYLNRGIELIVSGKEVDGCADVRKGADLGSKSAIEFSRIKPNGMCQ